MKLFEMYLELYNTLLRLWRKIHSSIRRTSFTYPSSPLSKQIMKLEQELGVMLWDRTRRKAMLTEAGTIFYQDALMIQKQCSGKNHSLYRPLARCLF